MYVFLSDKFEWKKAVRRLKNVMFKVQHTTSANSFQEKPTYVTLNLDHQTIDAFMAKNIFQNQIY
jgi:hypothetical protein